MVFKYLILAFLAVQLVNCKSIKNQSTQEHTEIIDILLQLFEFAQFGKSVSEELSEPFVDAKQDLENLRIEHLHSGQYTKSYYELLASQQYGEKGEECVAKEEAAIDANNVSLNTIVGICANVAETQFFGVLAEAGKVAASCDYLRMMYADKWYLCEDDKDCELSIMVQGNNAINDYQTMVSKLENDITLFKNIELHTMKTCVEEQLELYSKNLGEIMRNVDKCLESISQE